MIAALWRFLSRLPIGDERMVYFPVMEVPPTPHPVLLLRNRRRVRVPLRLIRR